MGSLFSSWSKESNDTSGNLSQTDGKSNVDNLFRENCDSIHNRACFGAGCYWGTEKYFKINFARQMYPESMIKNSYVGNTY